MSEKGKGVPQDHKPADARKMLKPLEQKPKQPGDKPKKP